MGVTCIAVQSNFRVSSGSSGSGKGSKRNAEEVGETTGTNKYSNIDFITI